MSAASHSTRNTSASVCRHRPSMQVSVQELHFAQDCRFYSRVLQTADNVSLVCLARSRQRREIAEVGRGLDVEHGLALHPAAIQWNGIKTSSVVEDGEGTNGPVPSEDTEDVCASILPGNTRKQKDDWPTRSL